MMRDATYSVHALCQGWRECDASLLLYLADAGRKARLPYFFWLLRPAGRGAPILVDTGFLEGQCRARYAQFEDYRRHRDLLAPFGIGPGDVETVILSHLHWDHFGGVRLFPEARFHLQRRELEFWRGPAGGHAFLRHYLADLEDAAWLEAEGRLRLLDGDAEIAPGVTVHLVGGHTPGLQVVRVRTEEGWAVLAVDAAYVYRSLESMIPPGIHVRVDEALAALDRVKDLAGRPALIFPGHDAETLARWPETAPGVRRLA
ncbi:MAG: N-acyl homoserine lactonase family protein [Candidatus Tectomicrobia bacterium]|nr:N-acyl homoserine lactonase family protein [Candidatus Tectomicrobia bacterium]